MVKIWNKSMWHREKKNMEVPDKAWDEVTRLGEALGSFPDSFIEIKHLEPYQDSPFPLSPFLETKLDMVTGG